MTFIFLHGGVSLSASRLCPAHLTSCLYFPSFFFFVLLSAFQRLFSLISSSNDQLTRSRCCCLSSLDRASRPLSAVEELWRESDRLLTAEKCIGFGPKTLRHQTDLISAGKFVLSPVPFSLEDTILKKKQEKIIVMLGVY